MRRFPSPSALAALLLLSAAVAVPFAPDVRDDGNAYWLEVESPAPGERAVLYFDDGQGIILDDSVAAVATGDVEVRLARFPLQPAHYRRFVLRLPGLEPEDAAPGVRLLDRRFRLIRQFDATELRTTASGVEPRRESGATHATPELAGVPVIVVEPASPVRLQVSGSRIVLQVLARIPYVFVPGTLLLVLAGRSASLAGRLDAARRWMFRRPIAAIVITAGGAAIASNYPIVFSGKSLTSPNFKAGSLRLYDQHPTLPGMEEAVLDDVKAADLTAFGWQHGPYASVQHRAIFDHGELPLWNRYNSCGNVLLAQGQSMFGDPLHLPVIAANGAAWAWDVKFILARWWFALGVALVVWGGTRHLSSALITAISASFLGFFVMRVNHPAVFSLCYAPWILVAWCGVARAAGRRRLLLWLGALMAANWMEICSGTAKEAYMLTGMLNLTGLVMLTQMPRSWGWKLGRLGAVTCAGGLFIALAAPVWWPFLDVLSRSYTMYGGRVAHQISPSLLLGLFDEIFYRPLVAQQRVWNPSANFLTLGGVLMAAATWRRMPRDPLGTAVAVGAALAGIIAFGVVPPTWIAAVPLIGNIAHIDNTFSCVLIVLLLVLAGFGYRAAAVRLGAPEGRGDLAVATILLLALFVFPWLAYTHVVHRASFGAGSVASLWQWGERLPVREFVWASFIALPAALIGLGLVLRRRLRIGRWTPAMAILTLTAGIVLLWRHGQHAPGILDMYVVNPPSRVDLFAPSPGIDFVRESADEPTRLAGIGDNLVPGWSAVYGLESLTGCDALMNREVRELATALGFSYEIDWRLAVPAADLARLRPGGDMFNVSHYVARSGAYVIPDEVLSRVHASDLDVFRSETAWPRAFFVDQAAAYDSITELATMAKSTAGRPFALMATDEFPPGLARDDDVSDRVVVPAQEYRLTANETRFRIDAPGPGLAVLHEAWLEGDFVATVNGRRVDYVRVNHAFKGVMLDAGGIYEIAFRYRPAVWTRALLLAAFSLTIVLGAGVALLRSW